MGTSHASWVAFHIEDAKRLHGQWWHEGRKCFILWIYRDCFKHEQDQIFDTDWDAELHNKICYITYVTEDRRLLEVASSVLKVQSKFSKTNSANPSFILIIDYQNDFKKC